MTDIQKIRSDFPILSQKTPSGKPLIYLDNAASTQKPFPVLEAMDSFYRGFYSNIHRGSYWPASSASQAYEASRGRIAEFIGAPDPATIIFSYGTTDALNKTTSAMSQWIQEGDVILVSEMEHHSNLIPWQNMAIQRKAELNFLMLNQKGRIELDSSAENLLKTAKVLSLTAESNALGTMNDISSLISLVSKDSISIIDAAQSVAHHPINVTALDCSMLAFSGHKIYGPMGIGVIYGKPDFLEKLPPIAFGGGAVKEVTKQKTLFRNYPHKHEAGTPNVAGAIGLAAAIDYLDFIGWDFIESHLKQLTDYALEQLMNLNNVVVYGDADNRAPIISFNLNGVHPHDLSSYLAEEGIAVRAGHHCAQVLMEAMQIQATCRISFAIYNTREEIDQLVANIQKADKFFNG